jgi:hypothetical protein
MIVLADIDYQQVPLELAEVIKACASAGKSIVFSLGVTGAGISGSPLADLCPLKVEGTEQVEGLGAFGQRYQLGGGSTQALLAVGTVADGAEVAERINGYPAVVRKLHGSGWVVAMAFDLMQVPFKQNPGLAPLFTNHALSITDSVAVTEWFVHPQQTGDVLQELSEAEPFNPVFVLLFLLAYIVLVGPVNFLVLRRYKRRTLVWVTIPLLIIIFSYIGVSAGYLNRGSDNVLAQIQELHLYPGSDYVPYQSTVLVFTAERTSYELEQADRSAVLYPDAPRVDTTFGFTGQQGIRGIFGGQVFNTGKPLIKAVQGKWTPQLYLSRGFRPLEADFSTDARAQFTGSEYLSVNGSFELDLPFDLYNCELVLPYGDYYSLGDLAGQGTYNLSGDQSNIGGGLDVQGNYLARNSTLFRMFQRDAAQAGLQYRNELLLVGFTEEAPVLTEFSERHIAHNLSMVVLHLPYSIVINRQQEMFVASARISGGRGFSVANQSWMTGEEQNTEIRNIRYFLMQDGYIEVEYQLAGQVRRDDYLFLSFIGDVQGEPLNDFSGHLQAEVWTGRRWQPVDLPPTTTLDVPLGGIELGPEQTVRIRYTAIEELTLRLPLPSSF